MSKSDNFGEKMKEFMQKYDKNSDGKIEMSEVSPTVQANSCVGGTIWGRAVGKHPSRLPREVVVWVPPPHLQHRPKRTGETFSVSHKERNNKHWFKTRMETLRSPELLEMCDEPS